MLEMSEVMSNMDSSIGQVQVSDQNIGAEDNNRPALIGAKNIKGLSPKSRRVRIAGTLAEQFGSQALPEGLTDQEVRQMAKPVTVSRQKRMETAGAEQMAQILTPKPIQEAFDPRSGMPQIEDESEELDASPPPSPTEPKEVLTVDLKKMVLKCVDALGQKKAAEFFGKDQSTISRWVTGKADIPLDACQAILDKNSGARKRFVQVQEQCDLDAGTFSISTEREKLGVMVCMCVKGDLHYLVDYVRCSLAKRFDVGFATQADTIIIRSRNICADNFLRSKHEWSMWLDSDVVPVMGNAPWFKFVSGSTRIPDKHASHDFLPRLLSHRKHYVGGFYASRRKHGPLVTQPELHPRNQKDKENSRSMRTYQSEGLIEVDWLALGYSLIHRSVFEKIREMHPELEPKSDHTFPYFLPTSTEGEDVAFAVRAKQAGFKLYLDTELTAMHLGRCGFMAEDSEPVPMANNL